MKNRRQEAILRIITSTSVETQEALLALLLSEGFRVTQATISRDIRDLKLVKAMTSRGTYRYQVSTRQDPVLPKFNSALTESVTRVESANKIIVIHTFSGMAQAVAACLDSMKLPDVLGCVAGDDTIMVVAKDNHTAFELSQNIRSMIQTL